MCGPQKVTTTKNQEYIFFPLVLFQRQYIAAWLADKVKIHINPDTPEILLSKSNAIINSKVGIILY